MCRTSVLAHPAVKSLRAPFVLKVADFVSPITNTDGSLVYLWVVENLNKEQAVSVTGKYFSF
jgi:hypothetical protein